MSSLTGAGRRDVGDAFHSLRGKWGEFPHFLEPAFRRDHEAGGLMVSSSPDLATKTTHKPIDLQVSGAIDA
jgi:hypothetical protein